MSVDVKVAKTAASWASVSAEKTAVSMAGKRVEKTGVLTVAAWGFSKAVVKGSLMAETKVETMAAL